MKKLLLLPLLFFPVIVAYFFEYFLYGFNISRFQNLVENILFGLLIFSVLSLIKAGRPRTVIFVVTYVLYAISIWFESSFYYLYEMNFSPSTIYILIETNFGETIEFLSAYLDKTLMIFTALFFLTSFTIVPFLVKHLRGFSWFIHPTNAKRFTLAVAVIVVIIGTLKITDLITQNLPYLFVKTTIQYVQQSSAYDDLGLTEKVGNFKDSIRKRSDTNETFVIVIGESLTRLKMSLYSYDRATNPKLESIKDELVLFTDVISPYTHTIKSLEKALTLGNYEDSTAVEKGSIIQLFNSVGFKSYWLSNQRPVGIHENLLTKMAKAADESFFINMANFNKKTPYDEELLEPYQQALDDPYPKKVIFIHLLGNHIDYEKRYPEAFQIFKTIDDKNQEMEDIIDAYDNATVYNDYVISEIINRLKAKDDDSFMLYFADHGEEVYQTHDGFGHYEGEATKPMYDIPFILWLSDTFKENRPIRYRPFREYMIDDLFHSIAHLANIKFDGYEAKRSVFSIYFENRLRIVQKDLDYNKLYK